MDSLGDFLKEQRLKNKITLTHMAKDTNIAIKYLEALENDEYSAFPGETYLKGFLRTYSKYVHLDPDDIIDKYDRIKMAETPTPIDQLIPRPRINIKPVLIIAAVILIPVIIVSSIIFVRANSLKNGNIVKVNKNDKKKKDKNKIFEFKLTDAQQTVDMKVNNSINIKTAVKDYQLTLIHLQQAVKLKDIDGIEYSLFLDKSKEIDLDNNNQPDIVLLLHYWDNEKANITIRSYADAVLEDSSDKNKLNVYDSQVLFNKTAVEDINLFISGINSTFVKYKIDDQDEIETFFEPNINKTLSAKKRIIIWLSNAGSVKFRINDREIIPGNAGVVAVKVVEWKKADNGEFALQIGNIN